ncbi:MAG: hypothetical protein MUF78_01675 [Candidatus Edwardsbacteria bacterium]|jgi:hypothetical protein|nr:hypothetical protein [Candidatus Edwardsbacteria bacterium]
MKKLLAILAILGAAAPAFAVFEDWQVGIRPNAMAGCYTAVANDVEGARWNPAGLAELQGWQAVGYGKRLWGIRGLVNSTATAGLAVGRWGGAAVSVQQVGSDLAKDQNLMLAHGFALTDQLSFGYNLNLYRVWQERFGSAMTAGVDVGLLARIYRKWRVGAFGHNLNHPSLGTLREYDLPSGVAVGVSYQPFPGIMGGVELSRDAGYPTRYKFGSEFALVPDRVTLRAGVLNEGQLTLYTAGFGVRLRGIMVGYAFEGGHTALNGTHQAGLGYWW